MSTSKIVALLALVVALASVGAGWKWTAPKDPHAFGGARIAGWTWDGAAVSTTD
jgi:hypothetical protein